MRLTIGPVRLGAWRRPRMAQIFVPSRWVLSIGHSQQWPGYSATVYFGRGWREDAPLGEIPWRFSLRASWNWLPDLMFQQRVFVFCGRVWLVAYPIGLSGVRPRWRRWFEITRIPV
jgi:hypothetical protein